MMLESECLINFRDTCVIFTSRIPTGERYIIILLRTNIRDVNVVQFIIVTIKYFRRTYYLRSLVLKILLFDSDKPPKNDITKTR